MARKNSFTKIKFEEQIQQDLNLFFRRNITDPRLQMLTITKVELSPDKSWVKVYWDSFDKLRRAEIIKGLEGVSGKLRAMLSQSLKVRHTPILQFIFDSQYEDEQNITMLLKSDNGNEE